MGKYEPKEEKPKHIVQRLETQAFGTLPKRVRERSAQACKRKSTRRLPTKTRETTEDEIERCGRGIRGDIIAKEEREQNKEKKWDKRVHTPQINQDTYDGIRGSNGYSWWWKSSTPSKKRIDNKTR